MIVPYKPVKFKKTTKQFKYIIIHDLSCRFSNLSGAKVDSKKSSASHLRGYNWIFNDEIDLPYHFLCDKIGVDYETIMGTPFCYKCIYDDIPKVYDSAIHIGISGDYYVIAPTQRAYQQIGYRAVASIMRWFAIPFNNVLLHRDISTNKDCDCPGVMFNKSKFIASIKPMILIKK
jgi:hypothetical protein